MNKARCTVNLTNAIIMMLTKYRYRKFYNSGDDGILKISRQLVFFSPLYKGFRNGASRSKEETVNYEDYIEAAEMRLLGSLAGYNLYDHKWNENQLCVYYSRSSKFCLNPLSSRFDR
ncbi:hypothetical protein ANN_22020 [Periplaneta americana]|uniref:Uncharacterized protein n=1 Tax=Periplaneta americana TaxID=6978 RepID=A0ABQ8S7S5_PERAM|nr:hypothetical protein ANN_22020 [Periplaneta americana]